MPEVLIVEPSEAEALASTVSAIELSIAFRMRKGEALTPCTPVHDGEQPVAMTVRFAAKAALYEAWREAGITKKELAERMGRRETEARRLLDLMHPSGLDQLSEAAAALGKRFRIGLAPV